MFTYSREQSIGTDARCLKLIALLRSEYLYKIAGFFQRKTKNEKKIYHWRKKKYTLVTYGVFWSQREYAYV